MNNLIQYFFKLVRFPYFLILGPFAVGILFFLQTNNAIGQSQQLPLNKSVTVNKATDVIKMDGIFDELTWKQALPATDFFQNFPTDSLRASSDTEVSFAYDDDNLYVAIKCHSQGSDLITPSLRRDYSFFGNDNITILFDTYNDYTSAVVFGMTPFGVRREAVISNAGQERQDFDNSWDNKWDGVAKIFDSHWNVEMAIPFNTLRYTKGSKRWRFNCYRYDAQNNEITTWMNVPLNRLVMDLGYMGNMIWDEPLQKTGKNISIIPYTAINANRDFESVNQMGAQSNITIGGDAKIGLTSGLNLDLTVNPDFSQVEVDQQVTNIQRFEIFFPEKRQFFLENADLFSGFGGRILNPFFSRRIGVSIDANTGQNIQNSIHYGARLSGKVNDDLRIGVLNMQTAEQRDNDLPSFNFSVAAAEQRITKSSRIAGIFVNKQAVDDDDFSGGFNAYNRVAGLEYRLNSPDNTWTGMATYMKSFTSGVEGATDSHIAQLIYNRRKYRLEWAHVYVGNGFITEVGFTPRKDFFLMSPEASINLFPKGNKVSQHTLGFDSRIFYNIGDDGNEVFDRFDVQEINFEPQWSVSFTNGARLDVKGDYRNLTLLNDFDPTRVQEGDIFLPAGTDHSWFNANAIYQSDLRKLFNYMIGGTAGTFYTGSIWGSQGSLTYRYQPFGFISLDYSYFHIALDEPFKPVDLWLVGPRIDFTFSKSVFFTTFIQYNNQLDNLNINTRFQWRFAPVSDLFLVYTDNYITDPRDSFRSRNRAVVMKLTYWLNL